jgi:hypothetical protein
MKRVVSAVLFFILFTGLHAAILWSLPNKYRIHPRLAKPILVNPFSNKPISDSPICLVGDSFAYHAPWPYRKIAYPGNTLRQLIPLVRASKMKNVDRFVVLGGQTNIARGHSRRRIERELRELMKALREAYPDAELYSIPPFEIHELAKDEETGDGWHVNQLGYEILRVRYPALLYPTWDGKSQMQDATTRSE